MKTILSNTGTHLGKLIEAVRRSDPVGFKKDTDRSKKKKDSYLISRTREMEVGPRNVCCGVNV